MKRQILGGLAFVVAGMFLLSFSSCAKPQSKAENDAEAKIKAIMKKADKKGSKDPLAKAQQLVKAVDQVNSGIKVPGNLLDCPDKYFEKLIPDDCPQGDYCSYYKKIRTGGQTTYHNLEFNNECMLCKFHKKKGTEFHKVKDTVYVHLGYEKRKCYQGMYK